MAVLWAREHYADRTFRVDENGTRHYNRTYIARTDVVTTDQLEVVCFTGLPALYDSYAAGAAVDTGATIRDIDAQPEANDPLLWRVKYHYSSEFAPIRVQGADISTLPGVPPGAGGPGNGVGQGTGNTTTRGTPNETTPTLRPVEIHWGSVKTTRILRKDIDGKAVVNACGDPFDPPVEVDDTRRTLTVVKNLRVYDSRAADIYQDSVNEDDFFGYPPGRVKCETINAESQCENGIFYWRVTYVFHIRPVSWDVEVLNQGYRVRKEKFVEPSVALDAHGNPVTSPILLDEYGLKLAQGAKPVFLKFKGYPTQRFADLRLP